MRCPNCQTANPNRANYCFHCGEALVHHCPNCYTQLPEAANFCWQCGNPVGAPVTGNPLASRRHAGAKVVGKASAPLAARFPEAPAPDAQASLHQFLPAELAAKLSEAKEHGQKIGERRVVTMLFCDVKGSTAAAEGLDPEDWTEIINGAFEHMIRPVYAYEGTVARLMGDGILAFLGAPIAHEDDPQRAVLAGLDIVARMAPYRQKVAQRWDIDINVRVGINTGMVVVGAVGSDLRMEYTAMGDAINLAARMEQTAEPGTVQIAHDTFRLVEGSFDVEELGAIEIRGRAERVPTYRVIGRRMAPAQRRGIKGLEAAMVGREKELAALLSALEATNQGIGRIVCVLGEAGLGKSRLIAEALSRWRQETTASVADRRPAEGEVDCFVIGSLAFEYSQPFAIWQRLLRQILEIPAEATAELLHEKLAPLASSFAADEQQLAARSLATLFGVTAGNGQPALEGEQFRRALDQTMRQFWLRRYSDRAAIFVLDDLHWADPASIELLLQLLPVVDACPIVLICAFRPDRQAPSWRVKAAADAEYYHRYSELSLPPLTAGESDEMVRRLLNGADMPEDLRGRIRERAGGNPFFIEEVLRELIDSGGLKPVDREINGVLERRWVFAPEHAVFSVPENLKALLSARVDRLDAKNRHTLELASVIGRSFPFSILAAVAEGEALEPAEVEQELVLLVRREMIEEAARVPELEYRFRSPLTQELVYRTILHKHRREFHRRVGEAMEALFAGQLASAAPRLAYHFDLAGDERALAYYLEAGDQAYRLYANMEATQHYGRALELAMKADGPDPQMVDHLFRRLGRAQELLGDFGGALETYRQMEVRAQQLELPGLELWSLVLQTAILAGANDQSDSEAAVSLSERSLKMAEAQGDRAAEAKIYWNLLNIYRFTDRLEQAAIAGERSVALSRELGLREQLAYGLNDLFDVYYSSQRQDDAVVAFREAESLWRELGNKPMLADVLGNAASMYTWSGRFDEAIAASDEALALSLSTGNHWGISYSQMTVCQAWWDSGDLPRAIIAAELGVKHADLAGFRTGQAFGRAILAVMYADVGHFARARELLGEALPRVNEIESFRIGTLSLAQMVDALSGEPDERLQDEVLDVEAHAPRGDRFQRMLLLRGAAEAAAARRIWSEAEKFASETITLGSGENFRAVLPGMLFVRGSAQVAMGRAQEGMASLQAAQVEAEAIGSRWMLWRILAAQADLAQDPEAARALGARAIEIVHEILAMFPANSGAPDAKGLAAEAGHGRTIWELAPASIPSWSDLKAGFLRRKDVQALMASSREME